MTRHASETNSKKVDEAGEEFLDELLRRFHCERSELNIIPRRASEAPAPVAPTPIIADEFMTQLRKYFNCDSSFAEDVPADGYGQVESAAR